MRLTAHADTVPTRAARIEARITTGQKIILQRAAALSGRTLSEFVLASAQEAAAKVIRNHDAIQLTRAEQSAFVKALLAPGEPGPALRKAAATYKQRRA